jgi:hypothetical protein
MQRPLRQSTSLLRERLTGAARASPTAVGWSKSLTLAAAVGVVLAFAGAFGTDEAPTLVRLFYWVGLMLGGTVLARLLASAVRRLPGLVDRPRLQLGLVTLGMATVYTGVVWGASRAAFAGGAPPLATLFWPVLLISAAMSGLHLLAAQEPVETHAAAPGAPPPRFLERLPTRLKGAELYAVQAEDHYLRLHTSRGTDLILMRLADAVAELEGLEGARTHRSWWVARSAVEGARRVGQRTLLRLKSGVEAPVSRSFVRTLRAEGWF